MLSGFWEPLAGDPVLDLTREPPAAEKLPVENVVRSNVIPGYVAEPDSPSLQPIGFQTPTTAPVALGFTRRAGSLSSKPANGAST